MSLHEFESRFAVLDNLPESLYQRVVTHPHGSLLSRARGVMQWRHALLLGTLPDRVGLAWPSEAMTQTILMRLETLDIVRYCKDQEELTDSVLLTLLDGVSSAEDYFSKAGEFNDKLAQQQKIRDRDSAFEDESGLADHVESSSGEAAMPPGEQAPGEPAAADSEGGEGMAESSSSVGETEQAAVEALSPDHPESESLGAGESSTQLEIAGNELDDEPLVDENTQPDSSDAAASPVSPLADEIDRQWGALAEAWHELTPVLDELGGFLGRGWDLTQGVLATQGWRDIVRYRRLIKNLPQLVRLIEIMGRLRNTRPDDAQSLVETVTEPLQRGLDEAIAEPSPLTINTTEGVKLSDDIARMLPAETALLGHPVLNTLWHAKRAESTLRCYQLQGVLSEHTPLPELEETSAENEPNDPGHGPIIICMDSSASMEGEPETIAKALTLEALRLAAAEHRSCYLYTFSGEDQLVSYDLDLERQGYRELLAFLQQSFHGGTDVAAPLRKALRQLEQEKWRQADILLISDGRFPLPDGLPEVIDQARAEYDVKVHGLLLGRWRGQGMEAICNPLHRYDHWGVVSQ